MGGRFSAGWNCGEESRAAVAGVDPAGVCCGGSGHGPARRSGGRGGGGENRSGGTIERSSEARGVRQVFAKNDKQVLHLINDFPRDVDDVHGRC